MDRGKKLVELCQDMIRIPSYSGREGDAVAFMKSKMEEYGFDEISIEKYGSVVGKIHGKYPGPTVLLDGHIDHVDVIDEDEWTYPPFGAEIHDGKIYGRATSDMKGSVAAMVSAAAQYAEDTDREFAGTICCSCSVHEECFEGISCRAISEAVKPDLVIIGEATTGTVKIGQRGRAEIVVETHGKSCHSSNPRAGINAVYHMTELIKAIREITPSVHPVLGEGIFELTDIISQPYPGASVVPSLCRVTYDRRTLVGETEEGILDQIREVISEVKQTIPELDASVCIAKGEESCWTGEKIEARRYFPAWMVEETDPLVQAAIRGLNEEGMYPEISHFAFCTNGSHFCGEKNIPCIGYGPSLESLAHVRDEYIEIEELNNSYRGFMAILRGLTAVR